MSDQTPHSTGSGEQEDPRDRFDAAQERDVTTVFLRHLRDHRVPRHVAASAIGRVLGGVVAGSDDREEVLAAVSSIADEIAEVVETHLKESGAEA